MVCRLGFSTEALSLAGSRAFADRRLEMVPRTDFSRTCAEFLLSVDDLYVCRRSGRFPDSHVLICCGDTPLMRRETFESLIRTHLDSGCAY